MHLNQLFLLFQINTLNSSKPTVFTSCNSNVKTHKSSNYLKNTFITSFLLFCFAAQEQKKTYNKKNSYYNLKIFALLHYKCKFQTSM